jgi:hypothetical protein
MAMNCPRCETSVPDEALYCPYCNLRKPEKGFAAAAEGKLVERKQPDEPKPPARVSASHNVSSRRRKRPRASEARRLRLPVLSVAALVAILGVGVYTFVVPLVHSQEAEPKTVMSALDKLRRMPSNEEGLTIDARLTRELGTSRRMGNLVGYQGWTARPVKGTKTKVLLVFSYQEVGDVHQRAEWLADLTNNTFTPQTDLAAAIYGKQ